MATSKCPYCSSNSFEMRHLEPDGTEFAQAVLQCSICGAVLGMTESANLQSLIETVHVNLKKYIGSLEDRVAGVERTLQEMNRSR